MNNLARTISNIIEPLEAQLLEQAEIDAKYAKARLDASLSEIEEIQARLDAMQKSKDL